MDKNEQQKFIDYDTLMDMVDFLLDDRIGLTSAECTVQTLLRAGFTKENLMGVKFDEHFIDCVYDDLINKEEEL